MKPFGRRVATQQGAVPDAQSTDGGFLMDDLGTIDRKLRGKKFRRAFTDAASRQDMLACMAKSGLPGSRREASAIRLALMLAVTEYQHGKFGLNGLAWCYDLAGAIVEPPGQVPVFDSIREAVDAGLSATLSSARTNDSGGHSCLA